MRLAFASAVLVALLLAFAPGASARPSPPAVPGWIVPGQVVVGLRDGASAPAMGQRLAAAYGSAWSAVPGTQAVVLHVPAGQEDAAARRLRHEPGVDFAEPSYILRLLREPNDTYYRGRQWNLGRIGMPEAWDVAVGAGAPAVAVIDSGVDASHPDLAGKLLPGWNAIANTADVYDAEGHGTHVAGLLAAQTDNAQGIAGVTWSGKVVPVKVSRFDGTSQSPVVSAAINWAVDNGARIINLSLGGPYPSEILRRAVERARQRGVLIVAAAGNCARGGDNCTERNQVEYPAAFPGVLAVGATTFDDQSATYSTQGRYIGIAAPGGDADATDTDDRRWIFGPVPRAISSSGYARFVGTSQAAPHVAGVAALVWEVAPRLTADDVATLLRDTAVDLGSPGWDQAFGFGRINAAAALRAALSRAGVATPTPTPAPRPGPTPTPTPGRSANPPPSPFPWLTSPTTRLFLPAVRRDTTEISSAAAELPLPLSGPEGDGPSPTGLTRTLAHRRGPTFSSQR